MWKKKTWNCFPSLFTRQLIKYPFLRMKTRLSKKLSLITCEMENIRKHRFCVFHFYNLSTLTFDSLKYTSLSCLMSWIQNSLWITLRSPKIISSFASNFKVMENMRSKCLICYSCKYLHLTKTDSFENDWLSLKSNDKIWQS